MISDHAVFTIVVSVSPGDVVCAVANEFLVCINPR